MIDIPDGRNERKDDGAHGGGADHADDVSQNGNKQLHRNSEYYENKQACYDLT
jgi:hypothetical protein